jgi:isopentenyl diphosphate isomerase/L-lactate dehydrogenase-like FMN-dependent dehydrogenase
MTGTARTVASPRVVSIEDLRPVARRRLPKAVFDYLDGGAEGEVTLRQNRRAFTDVTFRLCLGAHAVLCGRAYAYGLAAAGEAGVTRAIEILRTDLERTLRLLGCPSVAALDQSYVNIPKSWEWS